MDPLEHLAISPSGFIFDPSSGATYTANGTARSILAGLQEGLGLEALVERLAEDFDAGDADLAWDVLEFVRGLRDQGVLPRDFELE